MPNGSYSDGITTQPARCSRRAQLVVGHEPGEVDDVADALDVDLRLQLGEVAAAPGDHAADVRAPVAQVADRPGQDLEALLVLDPAPGDDERLALPFGEAIAGGAASGRVDAVGHQVDLLRRQLEAVDAPRRP